MSVATELTRIQSAKAALKTSIRNKGVSVSDDALISAYPALVDAIETGGGGDSLYESVDVIPTSFSPSNTIKSVRIPEGVTEIPINAFNSFKTLTSISLPSTLAYIRNSAFKGTGITSLTIPNSVTIEQQICYDCTSLISLSLDCNLNNTGLAFHDCPIETLYIGKHVTTIPGTGYNVFDMGIKNTITVDPENANFHVVSGCLLSYPDNQNRVRLILGTSSATIPNTVTEIVSYAFNNLTNLTGNIVIPDTVTELGNYSFQNTGITSFSTNDVITIFNTSVLTGCNNLQSLHIGKSISSVATAYGSLKCPSLTSITVDAENTTYDSRDNCNAVIQTSTNKMICGCKGTTIPSTVTSLGGSCFYEDTGITSINIPDSVTQMEYNCFTKCTNLTTVTIGTGITSIGSSSFDGCTSLSSVTIKATTPPTLGDYNVFRNNASERKIYVPAESVNAYKSASRWSSYASYIEAIPAE